MTRRGATVLLLWLAALHAVFAQTTGSIRGRIADRRGKPLRGVAVRIVGTSPPRGAITKPDGSFLVAGIRAGEYDVKASAVGFVSVTRPKIRVSIDQITTVDFTLAVSSSDTEVVIVAPKKSVTGPRANEDLYTPSREGFIIRGSRQPSPVIPREGDLQLRPFANGTVEREGPTAPPADARHVTSAPLRRYRPATEGTRTFSLVDAYPLPYGARIFGPGDWFTGHGTLFSSVRITSADPRDAGIDRYEAARGNVVEPSIARRAGWIRSYEEHRDMMSPYERDLASWSRRR